MKSYFLNGILLLVISTTFISCATPKKLTREESLKAREEWLKFSKKNYKNFSKEKIIATAEEVLNLSDGDDFEFAHSDDGFIGKRQWLVYAVIAAQRGTDTWVFSVTLDKESYSATFYVTTASSAISGALTGGGHATTMTTFSQDSIVQGDAIYNLFWGRMDFLLGLSEMWPDCKYGRSKIKSGEWSGNLDQFCDSVTFTEELPSGLSDDELQRIFKGKEDKDSRILRYKKKERKKEGLEQ